MTYDDFKWNCTLVCCRATIVCILVNVLSLKYTIKLDTILRSFWVNAHRVSLLALKTLPSGSIISPLISFHFARLSILLVCRVSFFDFIVWNIIVNGDGKHLWSLNLMQNENQTNPLGDKKDRLWNIYLRKYDFLVICFFCLIDILSIAQCRKWAENIDHSASFNNDYISDRNLESLCRFGVTNRATNAFLALLHFMFRNYISRVLNFEFSLSTIFFFLFVLMSVHFVSFNLIEKRSLHPEVFGCKNCNP